MADEIETLRVSLAELVAERDSLLQKHEKELAQVKEEARETALLSALRAEAIRLGAHDPEAVIALMDRSGIGWSDQGQMTGLEEAVAQTRQKSGFLFRDYGAPGEGPGQGGVTPRPCPAPAQSARHLPEQDYAARRRQFLAGVL
ncbi:phage scaffolding protein [Asaia astilbis]|uniref:phage scaffolding protein n=1 Tax=Asaia astilbis TaxID=610244 RepID=UPI0004719B13|nr:phage scaffolding protein [Asaia astilbis]